MGSFTLIAAVVLCTSQVLAVQHFHADAVEPACVMCAAAQHDDEALPVSDLEQPALAHVAARPRTVEGTPQTVARPLQLARAPPTL